MDASVKKVGKKAEMIFVICIFLFVIGCSSIPIFVYATSADIDARQDDLGMGLDLINCQSQIVSALDSSYNYIALQNCGSVYMKIRYHTILRVYQTIVLVA